MTNLCWREGCAVGAEVGDVSPSPKSTIEVEPVEYAVKVLKWAETCRVKG